MIVRYALSVLLAAGPVCALAQQPRADLIVTNARIYTVDDNRPIVEAACGTRWESRTRGRYAREALALRGPQDTHARSLKDMSSSPAAGRRGMPTCSDWANHCRT